MHQALEELVRQMLEELVHHVRTKAAGDIVTGLGYLVQLLLYIHHIYTTRSSETLNVFLRVVDLFHYMLWIYYVALYPVGLFDLTASDQY